MDERKKKINTKEKNEKKGEPAGKKEKKERHVKEIRKKNYIYM